MKRIVLALAVFCFGSFSIASMAADVQVNWTHPTTRTDGSALPLSQITATRVEHGTCNGTAFGTKNGEAIVNAPAAQATLVLPVGTHCIRAYTRAGILESAATNSVVHVVPQSPPSPPSNLAVTNLTAYNVVKQRDKFVLVAVGTVPANTACDPTQSINGHYVVPRSAVTWFGSVRPEVVVSLCG